MAYQLVKELSPDCLLMQNEAGEKLVFDKIPFAVPPRENLRREMQKEIREIVEEDKSIKASGLIKYICMEKYQNELFLVRENSRSLCLKTVVNGNIEDICRALLHVLKMVQFYHQSGKVLGGLSIGLIKQGGKNSYYLQDPLVINHLSKSLEPIFQIDRPPEVIAGNAWSMESDIFSWGVAAYSLITGMEPYRAETSEEKVAKIQRGIVLSLNDHKPEVGPLLNRLILNCLNKNYLKRPKVESLITQLTKLLENNEITLSETETKKQRDRAEKNRTKFKLRESFWLWFRKYGKIVGIGFGFIIIFIWIFFGTRPKPIITSSTKPDQVINYYFEGIRTINVSLMDEATYKSKNTLTDFISMAHVINATLRSSSPTALEALAKIEIEGLELEKISEKPEEVKYKVEYRLKVIRPQVIECMERKEEISLKPVKKVWRITDITLLLNKHWKEESDQASTN